MHRARFILMAGLLLLAAAIPARAAEVELSNGDVLRGRLIEVSSLHVMLEHPALGRITIPLEQVRVIHRDAPATRPALNAAASTSPTTQPSIATAVSSTQPAGLALLPPLTKPRYKPKDTDWKLRLELGGSGTQGDTDSVAVALGFKANRTTNLERWRIDASYYFSYANGDVVSDDATAGVLHDFLIPDEDWFPFIQGRYEFREFGEWQHRLSFIGGIGYQVYDTPDLNVIARVGAGGSQQFAAPDERFHAEGSAGVEAVIVLSARQKLSISSAFVPDLEDPRLNRVVSALEWTYKLEELPRTSLKLGLSEEYKSITDEDATHNNAKFIASLVVDF